MIRVMVVDDEALVRSGFELILSAADDIEVVATTAGAEAVETVRRRLPTSCCWTSGCRTWTG